MSRRSFYRGMRSASRETRSEAGLFGPLLRRASSRFGTVRRSAVIARENGAPVFEVYLSAAAPRRRRSYSRRPIRALLHNLSSAGLVVRCAEVLPAPCPPRGLACGNRRRWCDRYPRPGFSSCPIGERHSACRSVAHGRGHTLRLTDPLTPFARRQQPPRLRTGLPLRGCPHHSGPWGQACAALRLQASHDGVGRVSSEGMIPLTEATETYYAEHRHTRR
jgi:hypothetical protein